LRPLAHPRSIDGPGGAVELRCRILEPAVVALLDQRLLARGETFERLAIQIAVAGYAFAGGQLGEARRERFGRARHRLASSSAAGNPRQPRRPVDRISPCTASNVPTSSTGSSMPGIDRAARPYRDQQR
jgi:hypothetical protein